MAVTDATYFTRLGLKATESNPMIGQETLVAGSVTVANTEIKATDKIFLSNSTPGGTTGRLSVDITAGTGFDINSTSGTDVSVLDYFILRTS